MMNEQRAKLLMAHYGYAKHSDCLDLVQAAHSEGYLDAVCDRAPLEAAIKELLSTLNTRGELNPGGHDFNTEKARAYHSVHNLVYGT